MAVPTRHVPYENELARLLFVEWLDRLVQERIGFKANTGDSFNTGTANGQSTWQATLPDDSTLLIKLEDSGALGLEVADQHVDVMDELVNEAIRRTAAQDFGPGAWWKIVFTIDSAGSVFPGTGIHFPPSPRRPPVADREPPPR